MLRRLLRVTRERRGSVMVEFALVAPLLVLVLLGIMVMGVVINSKIVVAGAAREAGRTWAIVKDDTRARVKATEAMSSGGLQFGGGAQFNPGQDVTFQRQGDYIAVTVTYRQPTFVPLIAQVIDPSSANGYITLRSQSMFRVER
jgi:hypothetical protein